MSKYESGQIVHHRKFGYRGVVVSVDDTFQGSEEWYREMAKSEPPRDRPWYHVLVDGSDQETYVAERHLEEDITEQPVDHPLVSLFFDEIKEGRYIRNRMMN